jgi:hypothetical protein
MQHDAYATLWVDLMIIGQCLWVWMLVATTRTSSDLR